MRMDRLAWLKDGEHISFKEKLWCIWMLSIPAIFAQVSNVIMQYIDASMVGRLGPDASAAIGLVSSSTWLLSGVAYAFATGFTVQVAHRIGAKQDAQARALVRHGLVASLILSSCMGLMAAIVSGVLPVWLGGASTIAPLASQYFFIYAISLPIVVLNYCAGGMLQCSGNMLVPSVFNSLMCGFDILFNALFIFVFKMGVLGAALGTAVSECLCAGAMVFVLLKCSPVLSFRKEMVQSDWGEEFKRALQISIPIALESLMNGGAYVASTRIVAPLGTVSIAAHSFSITAEALCYMPGYGIGNAATTLIGQAKGADRPKEVRSLSFLTVGLGIVLMSGAAVLLYVFAPVLLGILTPYASISTLGVQILRIEAFAEPFYGAAIVTAGVFRGLGATYISTALNLCTMWLVRIPLSIVLAARMGLVGVWIAMCIQLIVCGCLFLFALYRRVYEDR